jgi:hypothetical protein
MQKRELLRKCAEPKPQAPTATSGTTP